MGVYYCISILSKLGMKSKVSMKTVHREKKKGTPTKFSDQQNWFVTGVSPPLLD
jgi:hypothetical protein